MTSQHLLFQNYYNTGIVNPLFTMVLEAYTLQLIKNFVLDSEVTFHLSVQRELIQIFYISIS